MSFFGSTYSTTPRHLHEGDVRRLVSDQHIPGLDPHIGETIIQAILFHRDVEHFISLQKIHDSLAHLRDEGKITDHIKEQVMTLFKDLFGHL